MENMNVAELRSLARERRTELGVTGLQIAGASKEMLLAWLDGKYLPEKKMVPQPAMFPEIEIQVVPAQSIPQNHNGNGHHDSLADAIAKALEGKITAKAGIDEEEVNRIVSEQMTGFQQGFEEALDDMMEQVKNIKPSIKTIQIENIETKEIKDLGIQHKDFEKVLKLVNSGLDIMLVGPAASGKTTLADNIAQALNVPFYMTPVGLQTTKSDLLGYMDANGIYRASLLRKAYEEGGLFLMDEIDAGNPNVLTVINGMLANGQAGFPDRMVEKNKDFRFMCAANTFGRGNDRQYVGRNAIDAATLDRFVVIAFDYDEAFEEAISSNPEWTKRVQAIRKAVFDLKERVIVSPRASIKGGKMLALGFSQEEIEEVLIWKGVNRDIKDRITARMGR